MVAGTAVLERPARAPDEAPSAAADGQRRLRFLVCGSVDDGKSTLIGRLLWDTRSVSQDHRDDLLRKGSRQNDLDLPDFGLLLDGLKAEQEQGITIDVAYRYFSTDRRAFIVADTPGHEQYTRNMATGASTADLAVLLVDARAGLLEQTRRHAAIVHMMGIRQVVLAVNKIDLIGYDRATFDAIVEAFAEFARRLGDVAITAIPVSALKGENVASSAPDTMPWYSGPTLLEALETAPAARESALDFRMAIQRVARVGEAFRGYQGTVAAGSVSVGDRVRILPSGETVTIRRIVTFDGDLAEAAEGSAVTLVFDRHVDAARGDMLCALEATPLVASQFSATVVALQADGLRSGARYLLKSAARTLRVRLEIDTAHDLPSGNWVGSRVLPVNTIGRVLLVFDDTVVFDPYENCHATGSFVLISPETNNTIAGGMIAAKARPGREEQVSRMLLSLPRDLADRILALDFVAERRDEIELH
jgi:sulfate adenylyltransferase subunit 1